MKTQYLLREFYKLCDGGRCEDLLTEQEKRLVREGNVMFLTGIMQRADAENGNGRIYPKEILAREVEKYQQTVSENRAVGECVDEETEIMTKDGWKFIKDISDNEEIFVLDQITGEIKIDRILQKVTKQHQGILLHFTNNAGTLDMCLTPNHRVLINNRKEKFEEIFAEDLAQKLYEKDSHISHSSLKKNGGIWNGVSDDFIEFPKQKYSLSSFAAFMGIFLSEGCANSKRIQITQKKQDNVIKIRNMLTEGGFRFTEFVRKTGTTDFYLFDKDLIAFLKPLGKSYEKYIPDSLKNMKKEYLEIMLNWMLFGDGRNRKRFPKKDETEPRLHRELYTTSLKLANDVSQIFFKLNSGATIQTRLQTDRFIEGRLIKASSSRPLYIVSEYSTKSISLDHRFTKIDKIPFSGAVYCVKSPTGNFLMKRKNGHPIWTLNCDHPDESVINLKNVSHVVTQIWWNGNDVMGKIKVLDTPSGKIIQELIKGGITLGISSRSLGSVKESKGQTIVEDDLQLICFDLVSEPSTQGAFMQLKEAKQHKTLTKKEQLRSLLFDIVGTK